MVDSDPRSVTQVAAETRRIGRLVGRAAKADELAASIARNIAKARAGIHTHPTVLLVIGVGRTPYAALANSWGGDLVTQAPAAC